MRRKQYYIHNVYSPGLTTYKTASALEPGEALIADNVDLSIAGVLRRRMGWVDIEVDFSAATDPTFTDVSGLWPYDLRVEARQDLPGPPTTNYNSLLAVVGRELWHSDPALADLGGPDDTWFKLGTLSLAAGDPGPLNLNRVRPTFASLGEKVYIAKSYGGIGGYDGGSIAGQLDSWDTVTFVSGIVGAPEASIIAEYRGALVVAGINDFTNRIQWSGTAGVSGPDVWPANNFADLAPGDGDRILGLASFANMLLIVKRSSVWRLTGALPDDGSLDDSDVVLAQVGGMKNGCIGPRTIQTTPYGIVWLSWDGVYIYNGQSLDELTRPVRDQFIARNGFEPWLAGSGLDAVGVFDATKHTYEISLPPGNAFPTTTFVINLETHAIATTSGSLGDARSFARFKDANYVGFDDGVIGLRDLVYSDNGDPIAWDYLTGRLPLSPDNELKAVRLGRVAGIETTEGITVQAVADYDQADTRGKDEPNMNAIGATPVLTNKPVNLSNLGRDFQLRISGDGTDQTTVPEIHSVTLEFERLSHA